VRGELADGFVRVHDPRQDVAASGVGQGPEHGVQRVWCGVFIYNHLVVDSSTPPGGVFKEDHLAWRTIDARASSGGWMARG